MAGSADVRNPEGDAVSGMLRMFAGRHGGAPPGLIYLQGGCGTRGGLIMARPPRVFGVAPSL